MLRPDLCHKEPEFVELQDRIRQGLLEVYRLSSGEWASILITGSGTAAMEGMLTSFVPAHGKALIIENGAYGERLSRIADIHNINYLALHHEWGAEIDMGKLESELQYHREITHVALVQHETTTGRLNKLEEIAGLCRRFNASILLDGISSFGAEEIKFEEWNIAACAATANKCVHGAAGVSFVIGNRQALREMAGTSARTLYLDLSKYLENQDAGDTIFTQPAHTFYALSEALNELHQAGGWKARNKEYWQRMNIVRNGFEQLGVKAFMEKQECSCVLNAFYLPEGISYARLHDGLKKNGFITYTRQAEPTRSLFRIACMGELSAQDMERLIAVAAKFIS